MFFGGDYVVFYKKKYIDKIIEIFKSLNYYI